MRKFPFGVLFALGVLVSLLFSAHYYFAARLVRDTAVPAPWAVLGDAAIALGALSLLVHPFMHLHAGQRLNQIVTWPMYLWLAACFYLLLGLGLSDLGLALAGIDVSDVSVARARALVVLAFTASTLLLGFRIATRAPAHKRVEVRVDGWPAALDGYRIVQLSDLHFSWLIRRSFAEHLVERCAALAPDLIAITGDLVDGSVEQMRSEVAPLSSLRARDGVFFITGNHDYFSGADSWTACVRELGIRVLRNERVAITRDGASFELAGVEDYSSRRKHSRDGSDMRTTLAGRLDATPVVLLAHDPRSFEHARAQGVQLQLSGHTHGGQMWPFHVLVRLQSEYVAGLYRRGSSQLYVSRGTGFWGPPIRLFKPAEITELVLKPTIT